MSQPPNDVTLYLEQRIITQTIIRRNSAVTNKRKPHSEQPSHNTLRRTFIGFLKKFTTQSTLFRGQLNQFLIIKGYIQPMGQAFANLASAASQLTADIHYKMFHKPLFLTCLLQANIKNLTQTNEHIAKNVSR